MKTFATYKVSFEQAGLTVESYLKQVLQYSGRSIQRLTRQKGILINGKPVFLQKKVRPNDVLSVLVPQEASFGVQPEEGIIDILYEDDYMMVLNKPAYQLVHPTGKTTGGTLSNYLAYELQRRGQVSAIRPVHRLDRDTSGCIIFSKDSRSQSLLEQQLKAGTLKRTYWALVKGAPNPPSGTINAPIGTHPRLPNRRAINQRGEPAITHYRTIRTFSKASLIELYLETGRTHQIRLHLAHVGLPIVGDAMYGVRSPLINRQALHAASISFTSLGDGGEVTVNAPLPTDFSEALERCSD